LAKNFSELIPDDQWGDQQSQMQDGARGLDAVYERCLLMKDGSRHWMLVSAKPLMDEGEFAGSFAMFTDIDNRKRIERQLEESNQKLSELTKKDGLTGISNRRHFDEVLTEEYLRLEREKSKLSLILLDVDYFKSFNDIYGHVHGDECLRMIARVVAESVKRSEDLAARYGGEEFACILPDTDIRGAVIIAERIRQEVQDLAIPHAGSEILNCITVSVGVATVHYSKDDTVATIITQADEQLYRAKALGRNRIQFPIVE
jgi:diguanylate cyclase (GGDEF)-like protein